MVSYTIKSVLGKSLQQYEQVHPEKHNLQGDAAELDDSLKIISVMIKIMKDQGKNQEWIANKILDQEINGIGERKLKGIFAEANKLLKEK